MQYFVHRDSFQLHLVVLLKAGARLEINFRRIFDFVCVVVGDENIWEIFAPRIERLRKKLF